MVDEAIFPKLFQKIFRQLSCVMTSNNVIDDGTVSFHKEGRFGSKLFSKDDVDHGTD